MDPLGEELAASGSSSLNSCPALHTPALRLAGCFLGFCCSFTASSCLSVSSCSLCPCPLVRVALAWPLVRVASVLSVSLCLLRSSVLVVVPVPASRGSLMSPCLMVVSVDVVDARGAVAIRRLPPLRATSFRAPLPAFSASCAPELRAGAARAAPQFMSARGAARVAARCCGLPPTGLGARLPSLWTKPHLVFVAPHGRCHGSGGFA